MQAMLPSISTSSLDEESGRFGLMRKAVFWFPMIPMMHKSRTRRITYDFSTFDFSKTLLLETRLAFYFKTIRIFHHLSCCYLFRLNGSLAAVAPSSRPQTEHHRSVRFAHHPARSQNRDGGPRGLLVAVRLLDNTRSGRTQKGKNIFNFDLFCFGSRPWTLPC